MRSLQSNFREDKTTYTQVVEVVRKELAQSYLTEGIHSVVDISYLLGYSEPCVFNRGFKKWLGIILINIVWINVNSESVLWGFDFLL